MKLIYLMTAALISFTTSIGMANPFDNFVGAYSIVGSPMITGSGANRVAANCNELYFKYFTGLSVSIDDAQVTHSSNTLQFRFGGPMGPGWANIPIMNIDGDSSRVDAKTTGDSTSAQNVLISRDGKGLGPASIVITSLKRTGKNVLLTWVHGHVSHSEIDSSCMYQALLSQQ